MVAFLVCARSKFIDKLDFKTSPLKKEAELFFERYQEYMGILIFGTGTIALCFYQMFANSMCLHIFRDYLDTNISHSVQTMSENWTFIEEDKYHTHEYISANVALQVFKIIFVLVEIAFLIKLDSSKEFETKSEGGKRTLYRLCMSL